MAYDPVYAREYYLRTRKLKGRKKGSSSEPSPKKTSAGATEVNARSQRLKAKVSKLEGALTRARAALTQKRRAAVEEERKNSDGKSTEEEKRASKEYRDKNKAEIAADRKKEARSSSSSGGGTSSSSSASVEDMSVEDLEARVIKIQRALKDAKRQLSNANQAQGQMVHSAILAEPMINEHFARFRSAERISSK